MAESGLRQTADRTHYTVRACFAVGCVAEAARVFTAFYQDCVVACAELGVTPLGREDLAAVLTALVERPAATLH